MRGMGGGGVDVSESVVFLNSCYPYFLFMNEQVKPMLAIWRAEEDIKDRDVSGHCVMCIVTLY